MGAAIEETAVSQQIVEWRTHGGWLSLGAVREGRDDHAPGAVVIPDPRGTIHVGEQHCCILRNVGEVSPICRCPANKRLVCEEGASVTLSENVRMLRDEDVFLIVGADVSISHPSRGDLRLLEGLSCHVDDGEAMQYFRREEMRKPWTIEAV